MDQADLEARLDNLNGRMIAWEYLMGRLASAVASLGQRLAQLLGKGAG